MRLMLVDDHGLFRDTLKVLLEQRGYQVVATAGNGQDAVDLVRRHCPELVLMDLDMPGMGGLAAIKQICGDPQLSETVKVVVLTASTNDSDLFESIRAGAQGFLVKDLGSENFLRLLEGVARGEPALTPGMAKKLLSEFAHPKAAGARESDPDSLTVREREVLEQMVLGITSNRSLAKKLGVSENTVKFHVRNILDKFHLNNRAQVVSHALRHHLVGRDPIDG